MNLYKVLASEYKEIFPSSNEKVEFVESYLDKAESQQILDIGCASGELVCQLSSSNRDVTGIDLDALMIEEAMAFLPSVPATRVQFHQADMLRFLSDSGACRFDLISCLGNTVVYLDGETELKKFLLLVKNVLKQHGTMIIQILNYSNPEIVPGFTFPTVETGRIEFNREYVAMDDSSKLGFKTSIKDKSTGETDTDLHRHYPFLSSRIVEIAKDAGFKDAHIYGGYDGKEADVSNFFHLIVLKTG